MTESQNKDYIETHEVETTNFIGAQSQLFVTICTK